MPLTGNSDFKGLKKKYAAGIELRGKILGIIGFGRIGQASAKIALGVGMKVIATDPYISDATIDIEIAGADTVSVKITTIAFDEVLKNSDFLTVHVPGGDSPLINKKEIEMMKDRVGLVNAARGGVINEVDLVEALQSGKVAYAALDVFENEPTPDVQLLKNENISLTPHIGAATLEAQDRIGQELAEKIIAFFGSQN